METSLYSETIIKITQIRKFYLKLLSNDFFENNIELNFVEIKEFLKNRDIKFKKPLFDIEDIHHKLLSQMQEKGFLNKEKPSMYQA